MLDFSGDDEKAKLVIIYYSERLNNQLVYNLVQNNDEIKNSEEARVLSIFYWKMLDSSVEDKELGTIVLGETDLQYWMERLLNIISGYIESIGYESEWDKVCDDA